MMNRSTSLTTEPTAATSAATDDDVAQASLEHLIEHAAHWLPCQGPITAFVHHNTLHAFEHLDFCDAVVAGGKAFGCHPYLPEKRYREKVAKGRIRLADLEQVLLEDLGERADVLLGFLGPRIRLRQAILEHPLHDGPKVDLRWVISISNALKVFRPETPVETREQFVSETKQWIMRDFQCSGDSEGNVSEKSSRLDPKLKQQIDGVLNLFDGRKIERWSEAKWESFCLHLMWRVCEHGVHQALPSASSANLNSHPLNASQKSPQPTRLRHRDQLNDITCEDSDELVDEMLIRFCAAYLDQGFSDWTLPNRELGFFQCFGGIYSQASGTAELWRRDLPSMLRDIRARQLSPAASIHESLADLGVAEDEIESYLQQTLLALPGFAGMIWQLETRGDRAYRNMPRGTLLEYVAVRLVLERLALTHIASQSLDYHGPLSELRNDLEQNHPPRSEVHSEMLRDSFRLFEIGQLLGWRPKTLARLKPAEWQMVLKEIRDFPAIERRRIYQLAFERKFRNQSLDAVMVHSRRNRELVKPTSRPGFQLVTCIDEREESFRRALEEIAPNCETLAAAGFFAVPIYYRGAADAHYTPLCPVIIQPKHYVREEVVYSLQGQESKRKKTRRTIGTVTHRVHVGSRTFTGGWIGTTLLGTLATFPLVARILFPRLTAQFRNVFGSFMRPPEVTKLRLERTATEPGPADDQLGFSVDEMAATVTRLLTDMGLIRNMGRLVVITGHGSSSMNNPHEAAHDCGACSGGRGGPNARAFSQMANDPRVRKIVALGDWQIPDDTRFVGCYHNTCDDSVTFYDLDQMPASHQAEFEAVREAIETARKRSAQERCRRFESAALDLTPETALKHVEGRAEDLSQVRPEYGHATNAVTLVGSRWWSRNLFLDRRAFLQSYERSQDSQDCVVLERILQAVIPVCAGISLEYYFSYVDPVGYGCGTKLPHNITALIGVMNGAASDLRPGLPWQMVEIHEPMRQLFIIETTPRAMLRIIEDNPSIKSLCVGNWVLLAVFDSSTSEMQLYRDGKFVSYSPESNKLDVAATSTDWYRGWRDHLKFASIGDQYRQFEDGD